MMAKRTVQRSPKVPTSLPTISSEARLDDLLCEWGEWLARFHPQAWGSSSPMFKDVRCGIDWSIDCYATVDTDKLRTVNAAVDDLKVSTQRWLVIHWHYAQGRRHRGPSVWTNGRLPKYGSAEYMELLDSARAGVRDGLLKRNASHLIN